MVVFRQGGHSPRWSLASVVSRLGDLLPGESMLSLVKVVFRQGGLSSMWYFVKVVFHQALVPLNSSESSAMEEDY